MPSSPHHHQPRQQAASKQQGDGDESEFAVALLPAQFGGLFFVRHAEQFGPFFG